MKAITRCCPYTISYGRGSYLYTECGKKILDLTSGIGANTLGYSHPSINKKITEQLARTTHVQQFYFYTETQKRLESELNKITPKEYQNNYLFGLSGTDAVDNAIKFARHYTGRKGIVSLRNSFHGRSTLCLSTGDMGFWGTADEVLIDPQYHYYINIGQEIPCTWDNIACVIMEPIQGERGGYHAIPKDYIKYLYDTCESRGIILIMDEVQTFIRTGVPFRGMDGQHKIPDITVISKGLASGFPLSCVMGKSEIMRSMPRGILGGTFQGNTLSFVAAEETLKIYRTRNISRNIRVAHDLIVRYLMMSPVIKKIRAHGLMIGIEFEDQITCDSFFNRCLANGVLFTKGSYPRTLRIIPPLIIDYDNIHHTFGPVIVGHT